MRVTPSPASLSPDITDACTATLIQTAAARLSSPPRWAIGRVDRCKRPQRDSGYLSPTCGELRTPPPVARLSANWYVIDHETDGQVELEEVSVMEHLSAKNTTILGRCVVVLAAILWGCFFELYIYLCHTRPHVVDVAAGRVYPVNNHGAIAFLTRGEHIFLYSFEYAAFGLFIVAAVLQYRLTLSRK